MTTSDVVRIITFLVLIYVNYSLLVCIRDKRKRWRMCILPFAWTLHKMVFNGFLLIMTLAGLDLDPIAHFINYWSQLISLQAAISVLILFAECRGYYESTTC